MKFYLFIYLYLTSVLLFSQDNFLVVDNNDKPLQSVDVFFVDQNMARNEIAKNT